MATFRAVILKGSVHVKDDNTTNIKIRVTHNGNVQYIATDLYVSPDLFRNGYASGANSDFVNMRIIDYMGKYHRRYLELGNMTANMTVKELKEEISHDKTQGIDFLKFADEYMQQLNADKKLGSMRAVRGFIANLKKYRAKLKFSDVNAQFLQGFETYMKRNGVKNGVQTYMSRFRVIFNKGREQYNDDDRGIIRIRNYPFKKYKVTKAKDKGKPRTTANDNSITLAQLKKLIEYKPSGKRETLAQKMFLLMVCLIGPNTKDLSYLPKPNRAGRVIYNRFKTEKEFSVKFEPEAAKYVSFYPGAGKLIGASDEYSDYLNFQKALNIGLKKICSNIRKKEIKEMGYSDWPVKITTNWARHTWATIARNNCRIPKDDVALCLGHEDADNRVTDMYIKYDYSIIDEANRKVINAVFAENDK